MCWHQVSACFLFPLDVALLTQLHHAYSLAYAELYLTVAAMVRNFDLQLVDSSLEDVQGYRDFSFGFTKDYKYGIKVRVAGVARD